LENELDVKLVYTKLSWGESDQKVFVADIGKAKRLFNWEPKINKNGGISIMIRWLSEPGLVPPCGPA